MTPPVFAFDAPLSPEAVREAYFLGHHNDQSTLSFFSLYVRSLPAPDKGPYIAEVELYTPYTQIIETSRRRSLGYSAQEAEQDYRHHHDKLYLRVRIDFTETYGAAGLHPSGGSDQTRDAAPLPDFYSDFRFGLSQKDHWIEPLRLILQPTSTLNTGHYAFEPPETGIFSESKTTENASYAYLTGRGYSRPTGWLVWLIYDPAEVASDDANVEVIATDGQHATVPFDLRRLR